MGRGKKKKEGEMAEKRNVVVWEDARTPGTVEYEEMRESRYICTEENKENNAKVVGE